MQYSPNKLAKQSCAGRPIIKEFSSPVNTFKVYIERTKDSCSVFLTAVGKHHPATTVTIARWIKTCLSKAGIDASIFKVHSIQSASTSAAADAEVSVTEIMESASASLSRSSTYDSCGPPPMATWVTIGGVAIGR